MRYWVCHDILGVVSGISLNEEEDQTNAILPDILNQRMSICAYTVVITHRGGLRQNTVVVALGFDPLSQNNCPIHNRPAPNGFDRLEDLA